ncbi:hypothetical protein GOP47_0025801 [Adiantum capillus-veneris]|uniref:Uncharacterized protein n=1 Tax=Adiantum capillus-veneris TaxID=13818 RepID=A0A9D4Z3V9_ADICA|nr:hypothetical protein GOP47_0025801 [Adiantum capillus-veneris]
MNPLTQVKNTQKIIAREAALGISEAGSWHAKYKDSAYIYAGNFSFDLTEGDLLAIFAQYGEIVDVNLVRDKGTGKSRGFAFLAYEDQRSTVLAVDNLNGASVVGRTIKVDHVAKYKKKAEEDEEEEQRKREERGVCRAFQRGECSRGSSCKFSHDEKRSANTGWGSKDDAKWANDRYDGGSRQAYRSRNEDDNRHENRSGVKERRGIASADAGGRREHTQQDREQTESRSAYGSERESTAIARKRHDESRSHSSKEYKYRDLKESRGQEERATRESDHQSVERDDRKDGNRHQRDDTQHGRRDIHESQASEKARKMNVEKNDMDDNHSRHSKRSESDKERRDSRRDPQHK